MKAMLIVLVAAASLLSCKKAYDEDYGPIVKGKLIYTGCGKLVVQVLDPAQYALGYDGWQPTPSSPVYDHVFQVANFCDFAENATLKNGDEFYFRLTNHGKTNCVQCLIADPTPPVGERKIRFISK